MATPKKTASKPAAAKRGSAKAKPVKGVALRASNGKTYFIPHHALDAFRVRTAAGRAKLNAHLAAARGAANPLPMYEAIHVELDGIPQSAADIIM